MKGGDPTRPNKEKRPDQLKIDVVLAIIAFTLFVLALVL